MKSLVWPLVFVACASAAPQKIAAPVGTLHYGEWTHSGAQHRDGDWVSFAFEARAGDDVAAHVRSTGKAPVTRVVDAASRLVANGGLGHPDGDTMATVTFRAPATATYYLHVRDDEARDAAFEIQLVGRFACARDADCERAGGATGDPSAPSPLDVVPVCREGQCARLTREAASRRTR